MPKFMLKCFMLAILVFFGVLLGMQQANEGLKHMKGYDDPAFEGAFEIESTQEEVEASLLGQKVTSHDLAEKQKQLEEMEAFNFFSSLGRGIAEIIGNLFTGLMSAAGTGLEKLLEKD